MGADPFLAFESVRVIHNNKPRLARWLAQFNSPCLLTIWVSIPAFLVAGTTTVQNSLFSSLAVAVTVVSTHSLPTEGCLG